MKSQCNLQEPQSSSCRQSGLRCSGPSKPTIFINSRSDTLFGNLQGESWAKLFGTIWPRANARSNSMSLPKPIWRESGWLYCDMSSSLRSIETRPFCRGDHHFGSRCIEPSLMSTTILVLQLSSAVIATSCKELSSIPQCRSTYGRWSHTPPDIFQYWTSPYSAYWSCTTVDPTLTAG